MSVERTTTDCHWSREFEFRRESVHALFNDVTERNDACAQRIQKAVRFTSPMPMPTIATRPSFTASVPVL